jgi:hypothetical protein
VNLHPILRRAATPELTAELAWDQPLKVNRAAVSWAIAIGQTAKDLAEMRAVRATVDELAAAGDDELAAIAEDLELPGPRTAAEVRALFAALAQEIFRLLASRGEAERDLPPPARARGPQPIGAPLSDAFRRAFGGWLSWDLFDPYSASQLKWGAAGCVAELNARLTPEERAAEAELLAQLVARWDTPSLLALERCSLGSWLENDVTEDALAGVLDDIIARLRRPPPTPPPGPRPRAEPLPVGSVDWPVGMATRFDTPNQQLQAKRRGERLLQAESPAKHVWVEGKLYPNLVSYIVSSAGEAGFGGGAVVERDNFGRPRPGRPVRHVLQLRQARVVFGYEPATSRWGVLTYYPTDEAALA